jgi:4-amino-4-deoxy-L-arabinose transferase-like glycosyltransferase
MTLRIQVKKEHTAIALVLILAFILRFYNILIDSDFLFREGTWGMSAWRIIEGDIPYRDFFHAHPPVSPYLLAFIFLIFGVGVIPARLFVIGSTIIASYVIYLAGKRINTQTGVISSLIFAISPISLYYGMYAVNDFVAVTFLIIGYYCLICFQTNKGSENFSKHRECRTNFSVNFRRAGNFIGSRVR